MEVYNQFKKDINQFFWIFVVVLLVISVLKDWFNYGYDDTDDYENSVRSGLHLRVDHGTGCQYLETTGGGITPRLDFDGRHICTGGNE